MTIAIINICMTIEVDADSAEQASKQPRVATGITIVAAVLIILGAERMCGVCIIRRSKLFCKLCTKYNMLPRNGTGKWVTVGCTAFRHDKVLGHEQSAMHKEAERAKTDEARAAASGSGSFGRCH